MIFKTSGRAKAEVRSMNSANLAPELNFDECARRDSTKPDAGSQDLHDVRDC